jgi:hypothetical protein
MATLLEILSDSTAGWERRPPVSDAAVEALTSNCDFNLPQEYLAFLHYSNGGEGSLCIEPWYFRLCAAEEVIAYNQGYNVEEFLPGWFAIGSDGGGELLAIRKRDGSPCPIYMVPFLFMSESDAVQIAHDFEMFAMALGRNGAEGTH